MTNDKPYREGHRLVRQVLTAGEISSPQDMTMFISGAVSAASKTVAHNADAVKMTPGDLLKVQAETIREWARVMEFQALQIEELYRDEKARSTRC